MVSGKTFTALTAAMIVLPSAAHVAIAYCLRRLLYHSLSCRVATLTLTPALCVSCLCLLWRAATSDPGFVPLGDHPPTSRSSEPSKPPSTFLRVCNTCNLYRPVRAHHCRTCNRCVARHDHHCPWINNCVGRDNHRCFLGMLIVCLAECVEVIAELLAALLQADTEAVATTLETAMLVYSGVMLWSLGALLGYQFYLVGSNQTTNEHIRHVYLKNPFDAGLWRNCGNFWLQRRSPDDCDSARDSTQTLEIKT